MAAFLQNASKTHRLTGLAVIVFVFLVFGFLGQSTVSPASSSGSSSTSVWNALQRSGVRGGKFSTPSTAWKVEQAERIYQKTVDDRRGLVTKLGPVKDIHPFPGVRVDPLHRLYMLWDWFPASWPCPHELERVGVIGDGGKWVCGAERLVQVPNCVIYSFGVEQQSSFEAAFLRRSDNCKIWAYDFSVTQIGPEIRNDVDLAPRVKFTPYRFDNVNVEKTKDNPETHTLSYIMQENGHDFIDLLKVDVEGSEFAVLTQIITEAAGRPLPFAQLQLEIHAWYAESELSFKDYLEWFELLESAGLRPFRSELNFQSAMTRKVPDVIEMSFVNIRAPSYITADKV